MDASRAPSTRIGSCRDTKDQPSIASPLIADSLGVLLISHITERRDILVRYPAFRRRAFLLLVLVDERETKDQEDQELEAVGNEEGADAELVSRRLTGEVEEGGNNVANAGA